MLDPSTSLLETVVILRLPTAAAAWALHLCLVAGLLAATSAAFAQDRDSLLKATAHVRSVTEAELLELVPKQSGLQYVDCPNCTAGHQERQLTWDPKQPDRVTCKYCGHQYPSEKYPMSGAVEVKTPAGNIARFEYWEDSKGDRYFFKARRDDEVRKYLAGQTLALARLYSVTKDEAHARRAALLIDRFAQVFPNWCYHYDYPFQQKQIYDGDVSPAEFRNGFRTARWHWWAYGDIPSELVEAYVLIRKSDALAVLAKEQNVDVARRIESDLFRAAGEQVISNRDDLTNMSPGMWSDVARLGQVLGEPRYVHEVVRRCRQLISDQFFYDGTWHEGAPSYGQQTVGALQGFLQTVRGYSDPPGVIDPVDRSRFDDLNLDEEFPQLRRAREALERLRLPNGRPVPIHDTWASDRPRRSPVLSATYLMPALGHGCLKAGDGRNVDEWHLTWSGGYGHSHADILSLLLFAGNREVLSDLGYSHTAYRAWTIATAAHNTVVIDGLSQEKGSRQSPTDGTLVTFDGRHSEVQIVRVDGRRAYPRAANTYERTLIVVDAGDGVRYAVDVFDIEGGRTHDYFLHGDADAPGTVSTTLPLADRATLLPDGVAWKAPTNEGQSGLAYQPHLPYGFLQNLKSGRIPDRSPLPIDFAVEGEPTLRVTLLPEANSDLVLGRNPAIRGAGEDDQQLEKFHRPFLLLRHSGDHLRSRFVSIIEPRNGEPAVKVLSRTDAAPGVLLLELQVGSARHLLVLGAEAGTDLSPPAFGTKIHYQGELGLLVAKNGVLETAYSLGQGGWQIGTWRSSSPPRQKARLQAIEKAAIVVSDLPEQLPEPGQVIRLVLADGWVYPFNVVSAERDADGATARIKVVEGLEMTFDAASKAFELKAFPRRSHTGDVTVEWLSSHLDKPSLPLQKGN